MILIHKVKTNFNKTLMYININEKDLVNKENITKEFKDLESTKSMDILTFKKEFNKLNCFTLDKLFKINNNKMFITLIEYGNESTHFIESELANVFSRDLSKYELISKISQDDEYDNQKKLNIVLQKEHNFYCLFFIKKILSLYLDELRYKLGFYYFDIDINSFSGQLNICIIANEEILKLINFKLANNYWNNDELKKIALYKCKAILNILVINPCNSYLINDANICNRRDIFD